MTEYLPYIALASFAAGILIGSTVLIIVGVLEVVLLVQYRLASRYGGVVAAATWWTGRARCRLLHRHNDTCRGRISCAKDMYFGRGARR